MCLPSHVYAASSTKILLFGDSIVAGYGLTPKESIAPKLEALLRADGHDVSVINGGNSGDTTADGKNRLTWTLDQYQPDVVLVELGANDMLRGIDPATTRANLDSMLTTLKARKVKIILSAVRAPINMGISYSNAFNGIYDDLASKYDVPLYPFLIEKIYGKPTLMQADNMHPNPAGASEIAKELAVYVEKKVF